MINRLVPLAIVAAALAGCNATVPNAPSLLPRPIEARGDAEPVVAPVAATPDPALDRGLAERAAAFDSAASAFEAAVTRAEALAARAKGAAVGSDPWINAQAAAGEVDQAQASSEAALADIEGLAIARATDGAPPYPALDAAIAAGQARLAKAAEASARLKLLLS